MVVLVPLLSLWHIQMAAYHLLSTCYSLCKFAARYRVTTHKRLFRKFYFYAGHKCRHPGRLCSNGRSSQHMYQRLKLKLLFVLVHFMKCYLFSVSAFGLHLYHGWMLTDLLSILLCNLRYRELLNTQWMRMNYVPKHSRDHAHWEYVSRIRP